MTTPPNCSSSPYSESQSLHSNVDSDTDSVLTPTIGLEPIRKSPREYIIPIAVEGGNYVTSRSDITELESKNNTPSLSSASLSRPKFRRPRRMSSLLSDASEEDESPFLRLSRYNNRFFIYLHKNRTPNLSFSKIFRSLSLKWPF